MPIPHAPKIYHVVHIDRLHSIIEDNCLWCDAQVNRRSSPGTNIGISNIKKRRLSQPLSSYSDLHVGDCVPFYFCPRSVMLYLIYKRNHSELSYRGGQERIVHLEADLLQVIKWAAEQDLRWAFTLSNAGSTYFEDRCDIRQLSEIDWDAVQTRDWRPQHIRERKQAEFLLEHSFPWGLISRIGVHSSQIYKEVVATIRSVKHRPQVEVRTDWYY